MVNSTHLKDFVIKYAVCIIPLTLVACVSPVSQEEFLADQENNAKIEELSKSAIPDTEECKEIKNFIEKDTVTKNDVVKILKTIHADTSAADTSSKLENIYYDYVTETCYVKAPHKDIQEYCSKKYYQEKNCINFLTYSYYPVPLTGKFKAKMGDYIEVLKEKEKEKEHKEFVKAWEKSTGCKYDKMLKLHGRWKVLQQIPEGTLIVSIENPNLQYSLQAMYGQSEIYLVAKHPRYKNITDGDLVGAGLFRGYADDFQQVGTYTYTTTLGTSKTVKKLKVCINKN